MSYVSPTVESVGSEQPVEGLFVVVILAAVAVVFLLVLADKKAY